MKTKKISIASFSRASNTTRARLIEKYGVYIDSYFSNDQLINIYALKEFFVQVMINVRRNNIVNYSTFEKGFTVSQSSLR